MAYDVDKKSLRAVGQPFEEEENSAHGENLLDKSSQFFGGGGGGEGGTFASQCLNFL